jgi:hypothetical protein
MVLSWVVDHHGLVIVIVRQQRKMRSKQLRLERWQWIFHFRNILEDGAIRLIVTAARAGAATCMNAVNSGRFGTILASGCRLLISANVRMALAGSARYFSALPEGAWQSTTRGQSTCV